MGTAKQRKAEITAAHAKRLQRIDWREWDAAHTVAINQTLFNRATRSGHSLRVNRPVPRGASCHYLAVDADPRNVYFY